MTATAAETAWSDALLAISLFATDPRLGGASVRALPGPVRDRYLAGLRALLPAGAPMRRVPLHITDENLLGGLDLATTLRAGRPVSSRGLLAGADGGVALLSMAERIAPGVAARIAAVLDTGEIPNAWSGEASRIPAEIGVIALDEGIADDEAPPVALLDRLAFHVTLDGIGLRDVTAADYDRGHLKTARELLPAVTVPDEVLEAICTAASALGVASMRAALLAVRATRAAAALGGRPIAATADATTAVRLVLAPRATTYPTASEDEPPEPAPAPDHPVTAESGTDAGSADRDDGTPGDDRPLADIVLQAAKAAIPSGLLARLQAAGAKRTHASPGGGAGVPQNSLRRGRPIGTRPGGLRAGARLDLVETLRAAAPWQPLRRAAAAPGTQARIAVRPSDFRIVRFRRRTEAVTIFLVDASGSSALNRMAEAKGAVELVLADCYVRRDRVALIAFRGTGAEILLPPTNSLVRARRSLAGMPGGGGTPLAAGIAAAMALAEAVRRKGQSPAVILLSDGRANIGRDGAPGRARAEADAITAARALRVPGTPAVLVDTSPRPSSQARLLAGEMGALYVPLPYADAAAVSQAVRASTRA